MAKQHGWKLEAVLNNDIVGGDRVLNRCGRVRVFSEGLPNARLKPRSTDSRLAGKAIRHLASLVRYVAEVSRTYQEASSRCRFFGSTGSCVVETIIRSISRALPRPVYGIPRRLHHQHQNVRTENGIEYGDLPNS